MVRTNITLFYALKNKMLDTKVHVRSSIYHINTFAAILYKKQTFL